MRPRLSELLARAHDRFDRFVITRRGRAEAVLLSSEEFDGLLETLEILSARAQVRRLVEADEELSAGGGHSLEDVRRELRSDRG
jgi:antitoxin YefM